MIMTTETFIGTRSGEAAGVHHDWFPEYTRMMHARNTEMIQWRQRKRQKMTRKTKPFR